MDMRSTVINGLIEAHLNLVDAKSDYNEAANAVLKYCETSTHIDDRISLPAVFTDAEGNAWIIHHVGANGLLVREAAAYREPIHEG